MEFIFEKWVFIIIVSGMCQYLFRPSDDSSFSEWKYREIHWRCYLHIHLVSEFNSGILVSY
jgi:hypothetical protein